MGNHRDGGGDDPDDCDVPMHCNGDVKHLDLVFQASGYDDDDCDDDDDDIITLSYRSSPLSILSP